MPFHSSLDRVHNHIQLVYLGEEQIHSRLREHLELCHQKTGAEQGLGHPLACLILNLVVLALAF